MAPGRTPALMRLVTSLCVAAVQGSPLGAEVAISPYTFTMDADTHQLHTTWEVTGDMSVSSVCAYGTVTMLEMSWTGEPQEMSSGNSWAVYCRESETDFSKMEIDVDVTKFRVQPFKSYKVCISVEDYALDWAAPPVCTHLFSFEKFVPYNPDTEAREVTEEAAVTVNDDHKLNEVNSEEASEHEAAEEIIENKQKDEAEVIESVLKHQLSNIENFVRDDYKAKYLELKDDLLETVEEKLQVSGGSVRAGAPAVLLLLVTTRTIFCRLLQ